MLKAEIELHYAPTPMQEAFMEVIPVEVSCITELENLAYSLQQQKGYRTQTIVKLNGTQKTKVIGLTVDYVSFGRPIERLENGLPDCRPFREKS